MDTSTLEDRIQALENHVRCQRLVITTFFCTALVVGIGATFDSALAADDDVADTVKAKAFLVVDDEGTILAEMTSRGEAGMIATYTANDDTQTALGSSDEGGGYITCFNKKGEIQVNLGGDQDGGQIVTNTISGEPRIVLSGDENGGTVLKFNAEGVPAQL